MITPWHFAGIVILIALSAFFSASEMAYSSANRLRLEHARDSGKRSATLACFIIDRYDDALGAILIGNNLVNMASSSLVTVITILTIGEKYSALTAIAITILVITFGETIPKIVAKRNANRFALGFSYAIRGLMIILMPFVRLTVWLVRQITKPLRGEIDTTPDAADELQVLIETVEDEGVIDEERSELLQAALEFSDISASEVMTSRVDLSAINIDDDQDNIFSIIEKASHSRLPVYKDSIDNIIGVLYINHFYKALIDCPDVNLRALLIEPLYVYKTVKLPAVLSELRRRKTHMAIVTDDYGGTMGAITMEDVLEQLVGEIWDESDEVERDILVREAGTYEVAGDLNIYDLLDYLDISENSFETESMTVGGWTLEMHGAFPRVGESFTYDNLTVTVLEMDGLRVEKVLVQVDKDENEESVRA